jgi:phosphoribosyl 1,2-cyclic phosphate phosphodiesterase
LKVTFLGTGTSQGIPLIGCPCQVCVSKDPMDKRLRSSVFIEINGINLIIDTGPDFRQQMLREEVKQLDAVIFTHSHKDHTAGFDDIRAFNYIQKRAMDVFANDEVETALKRDFHYIFDEFKYPGVPDIVLHHIENKPFEFKGITIIPILVHHFKMPVFGFRINDFTYITDANSIGEAEMEKIKGTKYLVLNALRREKHISHFNLEEAIALAKEIGAEHTYFTHISHQLGLHKNVNQELPEGIQLAFDGLKIVCN